MEVIHVAPKVFWRQKCTVDICVILHESYKVLEIIAYEPVIDVECSRIYIDSEIAETIIIEEDVIANYKRLKQIFLKNKEKIVEEKLKIKARHEALVQILLNRLHIIEYMIETKLFIMNIVPTLLDTEKGRPNIVCNRPPGLITSPWKHPQLIR